MGLTDISYGNMRQLLPKNFVEVQKIRQNWLLLYLYGKIEMGRKSRDLSMPSLPTLLLLHDRRHIEAYWISWWNYSTSKCHSDRRMRSHKAVGKEFGLVYHRVVLSDLNKGFNEILSWTHQLIANAKAGFKGRHRAISAKHLQSYLPEVYYRFNRRFWYRQAFHRLLTACVSATTVMRDELMAAILCE